MLLARGALGSAGARAPCLGVAGLSLATHRPLLCGGPTDLLRRRLPVGKGRVAGRGVGPLRSEHRALSDGANNAPPRQKTSSPSRGRGTTTQRNQPVSTESLAAVGASGASASSGATRFLVAATRVFTRRGSSPKRGRQPRAPTVARGRLRTKPAAHTKAAAHESHALLAPHSRCYLTPSDERTDRRSTSPPPLPCDDQVVRVRAAAVPAATTPAARARYTRTVRRHGWRDSAAGTP